MPAAPRSRPASYPVKPAACHPFLKEGEVRNAAPHSNASPVECGCPVRNGSSP